MAFFFAGMIANFAKDAGMKVPEEPDAEWDDNDFPHFAVFCNLHLGISLMGDWYNQFTNNAEVIAKVPEDHIKRVSLQELLEQGLSL